MEQLYNKIIQEQGYNQLVCDIFPKWEDVKDEILIPERKAVSGNGTIHIFLGAADSELRKEFTSYYYAVEHGEDPSVGAIRIKHHFLTSNIISMLGYVCQYYYSLGKDVNAHVKNVLSQLAIFANRNKVLTTNSFFKLSTGASKLRPYFKQFDSDGVFVKLIRQLLLPKSGYKISLYKNNQNEYAAFWLIGFNWLSDYEADSNKEYLVPEKILFDDTKSPLQQIFYGAPGTGKSNTIKKEVDDQNKIAFRTTFHPDSDYSTFVGCYKPMMGKGKVYGAQGPLKDNGNDIEEPRIVYTFVPQAFTKAYVKAWSTEDDVYLIIEEINRGNCAQIFGDLFQLLDRDDYGYSRYPIHADADLANYIAEQLKECNRADLPEEIKDGIRLKLPKNLRIWATMNTSDQSLFPIDSAFKRRWDWKYVPIKNEGKGWEIHFGNNKCDWWEFIDAINKEIASKTSSDDKKLGYFFCKPRANETFIDEERFVNKVLFYLWNDVFKDNDPSVFAVDASHQDPTFEMFFNKVDGTINSEVVKLFIEKRNVRIDLIEDSNNEIDEQPIEDLFNQPNAGADS